MQISIAMIAMHFIGDFLFQSDWMAINKSKRWDALALHVSVYSLCFLWWGWNFAGAVWLTHFITDAITSRITSRLWFFTREDGIWTQADYTMPKHGRTIINPWTPVAGKRHWFFVVIGADQFIHYASLAWLLTLTR